MNKNTITLYRCASWSLAPHSGSANLIPGEPFEYELPEGFYSGRTRLGGLAIFRHGQEYACILDVDRETCEPVLICHGERHVLKPLLK